MNPTEKATTFCVKPYLEMLRLVRTMGTLKFDELRLFGMQLTNWHNFDDVVNKIEKFLEVQSRNMRDYADACFRYLRK